MERCLDALSLACVDRSAPRLASLCRAMRGARDVWDKQMFAAGPRGRNALMYAAHKGDMPRLQWMLERAVNHPKLLLTSDNYHLTAYDHALVAGHFDACAALRIAAQDILTPPVASCSLLKLCQTDWLHEETEASARSAPAEPARSALAELRALLDGGARASGPDGTYYYSTPIVEAARSGCVRAVEMLAQEAHYRPSAEDFSCALERAGMSGHARVVEVLLREPLARGGAFKAARAAANKGRLDIVRAVDARYPLDMETKWGCMSPFLRNGHAEAVRYLLDYGVSPNDSVPPMSLSVVEECARVEGDPCDIMRILLEAAPTALLEDAATYAAASGNARILSLLLERGCTVHASEWSMYSVLAEAAMHCARTGDFAALQVATQAVGGAQCAPLHAGGAYGALVMRSYGGEDECKARTVQRMVDAGLRMDEGERAFVLISALEFPQTLGAMLRAWRPPPDECTRVLRDAVRGLRLESASLLLKAGADVNNGGLGSLLSSTVLHAASHKDCMYAMLTLLLGSGADVNAEDEHRETPLSCAIAYSQSPPSVQLLLSHGAKVTAEALFQACREYDWYSFGLNSTMLGLLLAKGCDLNVVCERGDSALMMVARAGFWRGCTALLQGGASLDIRNKQGQTVLDCVPAEHVSFFDEWR